MKPKKTCRTRVDADNEMDALHRGYSAGNYDNAYISHDIGVAWRKREQQGDILEETNRARRAHPHVFWAAYLLGFFDSYEIHEIPYLYQDMVVDTEHEFGPKMRAQGIAVESR